MSEVGPGLTLEEARKRGSEEARSYLDLFGWSSH